MSEVRVSPDEARGSATEAPAQEDAGQPVGLVIAHGAMAAGLVDAVRRIAGGSADALVPISNQDVPPEALRAAIDEAARGRAAIVFVDLQAGSCCTAALASCRACADRVVVTGVNLPMLLDFAFNRGLPFQELVDHLVARGRDAIRPVQVRLPAGGESPEGR